MSINVLALGMDHQIIAMVSVLCAVHHLVTPAFRSKAECRIGNPRLVVRMRRAVHIIIHHVVGVFFFVKLKQLAEACRKNKGNHPFINELVNGKRNMGIFHGLH